MNTAADLDLDAYEGELVPLDTAGFVPLPLAAETDVSAADPTGRAEARFRQLASSFADSTIVVSRMVLDEDWKFLTKPDGEPYGSMVEVIQAASGLAKAQAARILQGATTLFIQLMELVADGTTIPIK